MSYDLMAFDPLKAPADKETFMKWYEQQVAWQEDGNYSDISVASENLRNFYIELTQSFPSMNVDEETFEAMEEAGTDNRLTEYGIREESIYVSFAWSIAEEAYSTMRELAEKHKVGFFNVSSTEGEIIVPE
ncbi:hypothetical protein EBB07_08670 [Paenibacillaceae bacterium]|nr:hypothetical protein EBB07_08670 [Paenibacillaceae bacterium]